MFSRTLYIGRFLIRYATEEDIEKLNIKIDRTDDETVKKQPSVIFSLDSEEITLIKDSFTCSIRVNFSVIFEMEFEYINKDGKKYIIQTNHSDYLNLIKIPIQTNTLWKRVVSYSH